MTLTRHCSGCNQTKPLTGFYRRANGQPRSQCIVCMRAYGHEYWQTIGRRTRLTPEYRARERARKAADSARQRAARGLVAA
jgi:recombinational DNA repair protein (RecF pathway)